MSRTTFARAADPAYDEQLEQYLTTEIFKAAAEGCRCSDAAGIVLRPSEMTNALANVLALSLALSTSTQSPAALHSEIEKLCGRLHFITRAARHDEDFQSLMQTIFNGTDVAGHA